VVPPLEFEPAHWDAIDGLYAHGMSIAINVQEMESLNLCCCLERLGYAYFSGSKCTLCARQRKIVRHSLME
jgi:hypothetical protein